ncbi:unnamed protein product [Angiostrongylus costaricensis]|uniref:DUF4283 domain-containing protein n=1 Tax=Angiostrongylus costaricensis TaxID=334426 RepID=A0A158PIE2_ANGCS|nr:unnamed protein product [Angiostrongylus costaricensis]
MTIRIWVWLRGEFLLDSFLPLDFSPGKGTTSRSRTEDESAEPSIAINQAHALVDMCIMRKWDQLSVRQWSSVMNELGLNDALGEAIFRSASKSQVLAIFGIEFVPCSQTDSGTVSHTDGSPAKVHEAMWCDQMRRMEFFNSMDTLFEGMMEDDESIVNKDKIVSVSKIIQKLWLRNGEVLLRTLADNMRRCLVQDPFVIDDLTLDVPLSHLRKLTTLADNRRKVTVSGWGRLQLLSKNYLQMTHFFMPSTKMFIFGSRPTNHRRSLSLRGDSCIFGIVPPLPYFCTHFGHRYYVDAAAFNFPSSMFLTRSAGIEEEIEAVGLKSARYNLITHVLNLDESETSILPPSNFYIQPVPMVNNEKDVEDLLVKLPPVYRRNWAKLSKALESSKSHPDDNSSLPLKKSDLIYLKRKVVNEESKVDNE